LRIVAVASIWLPHQPTPNRQATSGLDRGRARGDGSEHSLSVLRAPENPTRGNPLPIGSIAFRSAPERHQVQSIDQAVHLEPGTGQGDSSPRPHKLCALCASVVDPGVCSMKGLLTTPASRQRLSGNGNAGRYVNIGAMRRTDQRRQSALDQRTQCTVRKHHFHG